MEKSYQFLHLATVVAPLLLTACASKPGVTTTWKTPKSMSMVDTQIAVADCNKQGLIARKAYMAQHPNAPKTGNNSAIFQAQMAAQDRCMQNHGLTIAKRTSN